MYKHGVILLILLVAPLNVFAAQYTIDPNHTYPNFTINHLGYSTMHGRFNKTEGTLTFDEAKGTGSVDIVIDANSVDTGLGKRNDHLRSPDFLNTAEFPAITFKSTNAKIKNGKGTVNGNLTITGTTKPVTLMVTAMKCGANPMNNKQMCGFDAKATIKRSDFGVKFGLPGLGDVMNLEFEVEATKQ